MWTAHCRQLPLFIVAVCWTLLHVQAAAPTVVSSSYTQKSLVFFDVGSDLAVMTFDFDQDIYYEQKCPQRAQDLPIEPTIIMPCCNSTLTTNCVNTTTSISRCIDTTIQYDEEFHFPGNSFGKFAYEFKVANPNTCHSVLIGSAMKYGIITVKLFMIASNFVAGQNEQFYSGLAGSNGLFLCCSMIRSRGLWDGRLYVRMELTVDSKWTTQLLDSPIIKSVDYFHTNRIEVRCADGYNFTRCFSTLTGGCWPMAPAVEDPPYFYVRMAAGVLPEGEVSSKRFSIGLVWNTRSFASANSSTTYFLADQKILDPASQCQIYFPNLVSEDGEPANPTAIPAQRQERACNNDEFAGIVSGILAAIDDYASFNSSSIEVAVQKFLMTLGETWNEGWTSCFSYISNELLQNQIEATSFEDTTYCPFTEISDSRYLNDPCCNVRQQEVECCRPRNVTMDDYGLSVVNADVVANQCQRPKCVSETIADFLTLQQSSGDRITGCTATTSKNLNSAALSIAIEGCYASMFEAFCVTNADCRSTTTLDDSLCVQGTCTVPCEANADCLSNQCSTVKLDNNTYVPSCVMYNLLDAENMPFEAISTHFIRCVNGTIDPVLFVYIARAVGATEISSAEEVAEALTMSIGSDQCIGLSSLLFPTIGVPTAVSTQELCESSQSCSWAPCDSNLNTRCNSTYCNPPDVPNEFCGFCLFDQCFEVSSFPVCKYLLNTEQDCTLFNGHYNNINPMYTKCIRPSTLGECYPPEFCRQSTGQCASLCYVPVYTNAATCDGQNVGGQIASFQTWTRDGQNYGLCTVPVTTAAACLNLSPGDTSFWPGTVYSPDNQDQSYLNSEALCGLVGTCNLDLESIDPTKLLNSSISLQADCTAHWCTSTNATNALDCDNYGYCDDWTGCYAPYFTDMSIPAPCPEGTLWTPKGCFIDPGIVNRVQDCVSPNIWKSVSTTRADCESYTLCTEPEIVSAVSFSPRDRAARPGSVSFKDAEECAKCGGKFEPYYEWKPWGEWVPATWRAFEWRTREMKTLNKWVSLMDVNKAQDMTYSVIARRYADILSSELLCRYGEIQSAVSEIVCDCTDKSNDCSNSVSSVRDPAVGLIQICTFARFTQTFSRGYLTAESPDITDALGCAPVRVGVVPISQFNSRQTITLSSISLSSARDAQDGQERFYKNSNNIVVGEVLGDGLSIDFLGRKISGVTGCIFFPDPTTSALPGVTRFAVFSIPRGSRDLNVTVANPIDTTEGQYCFDLSEQTTAQVYFTIALIDGWEDTDFSSTLSAGEVALIAIGIILYLIVLFASVYHFAVSIMTRDPAKPLFAQSRVALALLIIFLLIRVLYLLLFVTGTFKTSQSADVIFSELPALVFLNIYCIIVLRWAALYHFGLKDGAKKSFRRLKPVLYAFDGLLGAAFITLLIVYFSLSDQITITCESDIDVSNFTTPKQIVAIVYKAFFAVVCIILSIAFLVYGSRIIRSSTSFTVKSLDRAEQRAIKKRKRDVLNKIVITVVCTLCLLGQAANLLRASATNEPGIYILIFLYPIELLPSIMFIIILKKVPFFYRASLFARKPVVDPRRNWRQSSKLQQQHINSNKRNAAYGEINTRLIAEEEAEETANAVPMSETFNSESNFTFSELKIAQEIGTGNYGKVNLGSWKGSQVALKRSKAFERTEFVREAKLVMSMPPHQNLVQTFGLTNDGFNLMLVMEYCNGGSLDVKLFDLPDPVSDKEKLSILIGIAQGMQHLHQNKIIHRDLAARNILLNNNVPKVSDFGLSRKVDDILRNSTTRNNVGPIRWMAPEALRDGTYSAKTDVWSFGIVMFEVITQSEPHVEEDPLFIGIKIRDGAIFPRLPAASDQGLKTLMEQCCRKEPNERPDFNNICHVLVSRWNELNGPN